jgi:predicted transposase/invertase (TIGR01784 family)
MSFSKFLDPKNDLAFRRIFGSEKNKDILIHFINDVLCLEGNDQIQEVTFQPTIQDPEIASKKQSVLDVLCKDANGVYIIVEMQISPQEGFEKRAQYYAAKAYSRQLNKGKKLGGRYQDLKAVIFIAICDNTIFKDKKAYLSRHIILDRETYIQDLKDFSFTFIELPKFPLREEDIDKLSNIIEKWCYFFKYAPLTKETDLSKIVGKDEVIERAYEELNQFNWSEEELLLYEEEVKRVMDNLAAEEYLFNQGIQQGIENRNIEIAKGMLKKGSDISFIEEITGLSKQTIEKLKQEVGLESI